MDHAPSVLRPGVGGTVPAMPTRSPAYRVGMALELTPLRHFLVVAEEGAMGRAATRLHLTQPALSRQIARLERELGTALFERSTRGVRLTAAGLALLDHAQRALAEAEAGAAAVRRAAHPGPAPLRVAFHCDAMAALMPELVSRHRAARTGTDVEVVQLDFRTQVRRLREGTLDVGFVRPFGTHADLTCVLLLEEPVVAVLPAADPLTRSASVPLPALSGRRWIVMAPSVTGDDAHARVLARLREAGVASGPQRVATTVQEGIALAAAGYGVFACPRSSAGPDRTFVRSVPIEAWTSGVHMVWDAERVGDALNSFLRTSRQVAARVGA